MAEFGALIERARKRQGWTQTELGTRLGYTHNFVVRLESGAPTNPPSAQTMRELERELGISRREMLEVMGYLDPETANPDVIAVPVTDPRAAVLAALEGLSDTQIVGMAEVVTLMAKQLRE